MEEKNKKYSMTLLMLFQNVRITRFMQAADVFEAGKVVITQKTCVAYTEIPVTIEHCQKMMEQIAIQQRTADKDDLKPVVVHVVSFQNENTITLNNNLVAPFIDKSVRCVSDGENWGVLANMLRDIGVNVQTDQYMFIK